MKVMVFGTFDRLHPGHRYLLTQAQKRGTVTVVVARDANVVRLKGKRPRDNERVRSGVIAKEFPDMNVVLGDPENFSAPINTYKPDLILLGYDQKLPPGVDLKSLGYPVERLPAYKPEMFKSSLL